MLIDAHIHLDHYEGHQLEVALDQIKQHKILALSNGMHPESYQRTLSIAAQCEFIIPTFGVHPWCAAKWVDRLTEMDTLIEQSPIFGELGLDYRWVDQSTIPAQHQVLEHFLAAAREQDKILNLHTKDAEVDILALLKKYQRQRAIIHWYSGPFDILREMIEFGLYFTVGVEVLYSDHIKKIVREIPLGQLLLETDNPGAREWFAKTPGYPSDLLSVLQTVAELKGISPETLEQVVADNFCWLVRDDLDGYAVMTDLKRALANQVETTS